MKPFFLLILICSGSFLFAQTKNTPQLVNFQAVAIDAQGDPLANKDILIRITIRQGGKNGDPIYCGLHSTPTNEYGLFSFKINQNPLGIDCNGAQTKFPEIPWEKGNYWLAVEYSYDNGGSYTTIDPLELASVPFALFAAEVENVKTNGAADGQVLKYNENTKKFEPANDETAGFSLYQGDGIKITVVPGNPNINGIALADNGVTSGKIEDGAVIGSKLAPGSVSADKLSIPAANGQVLKFNNGTWAAGTDENGPGGGTVNITGVSPGITVNNLGNNTFSIQNTGDINPGDDLTTGTQAGGDLNGPFSNLQINAAAVSSNELADNAVTQSKILDGAVSGSKITNGAVTAAKLGIPATNNQVLKYIGGTWTAGTDETVSGGGTVNITGVSPGITVNNLGNNTFSIQNTGDTNSGDDLTTGTQAGGDLNGTFSNLQINAAAVASNELANNAVITAKIADGAITAPKLNSMGAVSGQVLKFSNGAWGPGTDIGGSGTSPWNLNNTNIYNSNSGNVGIGTSFPDAKLEVTSPENVIVATNTGTITNDWVAVNGTSTPTDYYGIGGQFTGGYQGVRGRVNPTGDRFYTGVEGSVEGGNGFNYGVNGLASGLFHNYGVYGSAGGGGGEINYGVYGSAYGGTINYAGYFDGSLRTSNLMVNDVYDNTSVNLEADANSVGRGYFRGQNGNRIVYLGSPFYSYVEYPNNGFVSVSDENGDIQAGMVVDPSGQGVLYADIKNFKMDHPTDPSKEIWYASIEGPEAAAYVRGTGRIINGEAFILFPDHFSIVANPNTLTVVITPGSSETYGLAVIEKLQNGFKVKELKGGKGTFSFDWEAKAIRKGYENYQPVRSKFDTPSAPIEKQENNFNLMRKTKPLKPNLGKEKIKN